MNMPLVSMNRRRRIGGAAAFTPAGLFALAEPGVWYDPSDVANLDWRRNLLTFTEQFDNAAWPKFAGWAVSTNSIAAPDGTLTADAIVPTAGTSTPYTLRTLTVSATSHSATIYVKAGNAGVQWVRFLDGNHSNGQAWFDIIDGVAGTKQAGIATTSITAAANGFWRIEIVLTKSNTSFEFALAYASADGNGATTKTWNGTEIAFYVWGAQLELGSVATDYQRISDVNTEVIERFPSATLYQDTAGTTPVTTPGQTVALALDKSKGLVLGSELVTNGTFDTNLTGWGVTNVVWSSGTALFTGVPTLTQSMATTSGNTYRVTITVSGLTGGSLWLRLTGGSAVNSSSLGNGVHTFLMRSNGNTTLLIEQFSGTITAGSIDNISVKELPGFHATQATLASRPTYGIVPVGGRRNLLTRTEEFDDAVWSKGRATLTANAATAPNGTVTADRLEPNATHPTGSGLVSQSVTITSGATLAGSFYFKAGNATWAFLRVDDNGTTNTASIWFNISTGAVGTTTTSGTGVGVSGGAVTSVGNGWYRCSAIFTTSAVTTIRFYAYGAVDANGSTASTLGNFSFIWGAQLETGSSATNYQRVGSAFDVTEAGVASLSYLFFEISDFLQTPAINFTGTDAVTVWAGLRKNSDTARGTVVELTASAAANNGAFHLTAPNAASATYAFESKGTTLTDAVATGVTAPITSVLCGYSDISLDQNILRVNGVQADSDTGDQGTGTFSNAIMYIGMRAGTSLPANMQLYSLIVRGAATDVTTIGQGETWVGGKTGVTL